MKLIMHFVVRGVLCGRSPALFMTVAILLCFQIQAQNPKNKVKPKADEASQSIPEPRVAKPDLSKEFMLLGRKAFAAIDRLNEHLLDTKDVVSHGGIQRLSDEKESWVLHQTTTEKAADDVQAVAETPVEKHIAQIVEDAVLLIHRNHDLIDNETEVAVRDANARESSIEGADVVGSGSRAIIDLLNIAREKAIDPATSATKELLSGPCYLAAKEAVSTGVLETVACESAKRNAADKELAEAEHRNAIAKQLTEGSGGFWAVRADGHILIWTLKIDLKATTSPEEDAATFYKGNVDPESNRVALRSVGFTQVRLEIGSKTFDWLIQ
jgi:hypothetical protein